MSCSRHAAGHTQSDSGSWGGPRTCMGTAYHGRHVWAYYSVQVPFSVEVYTNLQDSILAKLPPRNLDPVLPATRRADISSRPGNFARTRRACRTCLIFEKAPIRWAYHTRAISPVVRPRYFRWVQSTELSPYLSIRKNDNS